MVLGAIWYSPLLFGQVWMQGIGKSKEQVAADSSSANYIGALVTSFVASYGIARLMVWTARDTIADGIVFGLFVGICFVSTSMGVSDSFEGRRRSLSVINIMYHITGLIVVGIIIGAW
jgi:hypothetical protein